MSAKLLEKRAFSIQNKFNWHHLIAVLVIFVISFVVTFSNLGWTKEFIGDDAGVGSHYSNEQLDKTLGMWDSYTFPGKSNVTSTFEVFHVTFINVLHHVGLTSVMIDRLFYFLIYFISGLGLYLLAFEICSKLFIADKKKIALACLTGAIFYMLNNFTMILLSFPPTSYIYSYMLLPWIFLLYLKDYHVSPSLFKKLLFALLFLLVLSGNPSNTLTIVALISFYEIFFRKDNKIIHNKKNFAFTFILILLLSSYIILPTLGNKGNPYDISDQDIKPSILYNSSLTSIENLLRFRGHPAQASYIFDKFLIEKLVTNLNYILLGIASFFLLRKRIRRNELFLFVIFILFLLLAKSVHQPFPELNTWLFDKVPFFGMYRATYYKFIYFCIFAFSLLLGVSILNIDEKLSKIRSLLVIKWLILICPLAIVLFSAKPFFDGVVVAKIHKTTTPVEYHQINAFFADDPQDFSILALPQMPMGLTLDWGNKNYYAGGANPDYYLLGRPVWSSGWFLPDRPISDQLSFYKNLLGLTDTKYIFLHKDMPEEYLFEVDIYGNIKGQTKYRALDSELMQDKDFALIQENNFFKIYKLKPDLFQPHIYVPKENVVSSETVGKFLKNDVEAAKIQHGAIYFKEQNIGKDTVLSELTNINLKNDAPSLEYKKISANKYRIIVHGAGKEFPLVFSESYNEGWNLYTGEVNEPGSDSGHSPSKNFVSESFQGTTQNDNLKDGTIVETLLRAPLSQSSHLLVNGYANGWIIDPAKVCADKQKCIKNSDGTYDLELILEFGPQRLFIFGLILAGLTVLFSVVIILKKCATNKKSSQIQNVQQSNNQEIRENN